MMISMALSVMLAAAGAPEATAAGLLEQMEARLADAEGLSLRAALSVDKRDATDAEVELSISGSALRSRTRGRIDGSPADITVVTTGRTLALEGAEGFFESRQGAAVPDGFAETMARVVARAGVVSIMMAIDNFELEDLAGVFTTSNARLGADEQLEGTRARVIHYTLRIGGAESANGLDLDATLWLDADTLLPLRRVVAAPGEGLVTETYGQLELSASFPEEHFDAP